MGVSDSQIYASLKDDLVRYATALVGPDSAGDVVSTVVVRVLARGSLGDLREPRAYLFRAVLNEATSTRRRARHDRCSSLDHRRILGGCRPGSRRLTGLVAGVPPRTRSATTAKPQGTGAAAWTSPDGITWSPAQVENESEASAGWLWDVIADDDRPIGPGFTIEESD